MVNLLPNLSDLSIHRLLMGCHGVKFRVQLVDRRIQNFISLSLSSDELLHKTLQIGLGWRRLLVRRWIIWHPLLKTRRLRLKSIRRKGVVVSVGEVRMVSLTRIVCV